MRMLLGMGHNSRYPEELGNQALFNGTVYTGRSVRVTHTNHVCILALWNEVAYNRYARCVLRGITSGLIRIDKGVRISWVHLNGSPQAEGDGGCI